MNLFFVLLMLFSPILNNYEEREKEEIRRLFYFSIQSIDTLKKFEQKLKSIEAKLDKDFLLAYNGAYYTLIAKHSLNPYTKYFKLKDGIELLSKSINNQPENLEFRFLRLSALNYVPSFLGFDKYFFEDYEKVIEIISRRKSSGVDRKTQKGIIEFLLRSKKLNDEQKKVVQKIYQEFE